MSVPTETLHATSVAIAGQGVLILGPSGAGKSSLALQLITLGAVLISDDRSIIERRGDLLIASAPASIQGQIEARGVGILRVPCAGPTPLVRVVDLSQVEQKRLPEPHSHSVLGVSLPCLHKADTPHFAAAILLSLSRSISSGS